MIKIILTDKEYEMIRTALTGADWFHAENLFEYGLDAKEILTLERAFKKFDLKIK